MSGKQPSLMWKYFKAISKDQAQCSICEKYFATKGGSTSGLRKHSATHKNQYEEFSLDQAERDRISAPFIQKSVKRDASEALYSQNKHAKQTRIDDFKTLNVNIDEKQKIFDESLVYFVAETGVAFNVLGTTSFKNTIEIANRRLKVKTPKTISRHVETISQQVMSQVHDIMSAVKSTIPSIGFTTDMWTSLAQDSYISLTTSFIDQDFFMHRWTPFVKPFPAKHTGVNISLGLDRMIESLGLQGGNRKLWSVNDNARNMKVGIKESQYLTEYNCTIHTLQLAVNDSFKQVPGMKAVLRKSKKLARFCKKSPPRMKELKIAVEASGLKFRKPKNPGQTRWDSQYDSMNSIKPYKEMINNLCLNNT